MNYIVLDLEWNQCPYGKGREKEVRYDKNSTCNWIGICHPVCVKQFSDEEFQQ